MTRVALAASFVALAVAGAPGGSPRQPGPLRGDHLSGPTVLRLLVADEHPFVLDVDSGRVVPVRAPRLRGIASVLGVGGRRAFVVTGVGPAGKVYAFRDRPPRLSYLGAGGEVAPAGDGHSVWVKSFADSSRCALRRVGIGGRELRAPVSFPCRATITAGGSLGLVASRVRVFDPVTGRTLLATRWGVVAAAGRVFVLAGPGTQFTLLDGVTRKQRTVRWPSILRGMDRPAVDPRGRFVALAFADPAWTGGEQALDVWLLDPRTGELTQLPGMPALVSLKRTNMSWTDDGRLVLLAQRNGKDVVAVWRPGRERLALKYVRLARSGGSDTFARVR